MRKISIYLKSLKNRHNADSSGFLGMSPFFLMFGSILLLNINCTILKSVRNTLAVVDLGTGAHTIPVFELFGALPCSILMTWGLSWLMERFSIYKVFCITLAVFLGFFLIFAEGLYPLCIDLKQKGVIGVGALQLLSLAFYVMGELWKPSLAIILFWGLVNQYTPLSEAKKLYAPLMLGGSLGSILAGPFISFATSHFSWTHLSLSSERWSHSLSVMMWIVTLLGIISAALYRRLWLHFSHLPKNGVENPSPDFSLKESLFVCLKNNQVRLLAWIVIADYVAYSLGEVLFLNLLKMRFPNACDYCNYMGTLSAWNGIATVISALLITPFILQRYRWVIAALATPLCLLLTEGAFFLLLRGKGMSGAWFGWTEAQWLGIVIFFGSLQYCLCRAVKYTLFDASKELVFVSMPTLQKMQGKLVIDGICARLGKGGASLLSIGLISVCGGVVASALCTGFIAISMIIGWIGATCKLGRLLHKEEEGHAHSR
jgi:AAA family ATP:ADP antiporter